jgi:hypothetical protein
MNTAAAVGCIGGNPIFATQAMIAPATAATQSFVM